MMRRHFRSAATRLVSWIWAARSTDALELIDDVISLYKKEMRLRNINGLKVMLGGLFVYKVSHAFIFFPCDNTPELPYKLWGVYHVHHVWCRVSILHRLFIIVGPKLDPVMP